LRAVSRNLSWILKFTAAAAAEFDVAAAAADGVCADTQVKRFSRN
jgi:hypothetical protein